MLYLPAWSWQSVLVVLACTWPAKAGLPLTALYDGSRASPGQRHASQSPGAAGRACICSQGCWCALTNMLCCWRTCSVQHPLHVEVLVTSGVHSWPPACSARRQAVKKTHGTTSAGRRAFAERTGRTRWFELIDSLACCSTTVAWGSACTELAAAQVFVDKKICEARGCTTIATFGAAGGEAQFCQAHMLPTMVRVLAQGTR